MTISKRGGKKSDNLEMVERNLKNVAAVTEETHLEIPEVYADPYNSSVLRKRLPILDWLPKYSKGYSLRDFIAGITVGLTAVPQGIAYAVVAGLEPQYGLYATIMPCFVYIVFGSCREITLGPTAIMSLMTYPYVINYGPEYAISLAFIAGILILLFSALRLGTLVDFISFPVTAGFTSAAALTIASAQVKSFLGLRLKSANFLNGWIEIFQHADEIQISDTFLGSGTILVLLLSRILKNKSTDYENEDSFGKFRSNVAWFLGLSGNAVVVIMGSILGYCLTENGKAPFQLTGNVTGGLPSFQPPPFSFKNETFPTMLENMGSAVFSIPLISIMETVAIAKAFEKGKGVDATQEMLTLGLSNVAGSFIGAMPISGSFTRSAINQASGVKTPLGGLFTGLLVIMSLQFLTSFFYYIPKATLAGLIITAMFFMVEFHIVSLLWKTKKTDLVPFATSFFACLFFSIEIGMILGISVNLAFVLYEVAKPAINANWIKVNNQPVLLVTPMQNLMFPATSRLRDVILTEISRHNENIPVVLIGSQVQIIDSTVAKAIKSLSEDLKSRGNSLFLWKWEDSALMSCIGYDPRLERLFSAETSIDSVLTSRANYQSMCETRTLSS